MGGWTCLRFAIEHPRRVEGLVMCDTHGGLRTPEIDAALANAGLTASAPPGVHPAAGVCMFEEQPRAYFLFSAIGAINRERNVTEMNAIIRAAGTRSVEELAVLAIPVLFIAGEEDIVIPPPVIELAAARMTNARVERVLRAGHSVYFERPDEFNAIVDRFLRKTTLLEAD
jgi:pimeloyl-ACP methyl ester carboxylesterase